MANTAMAVITSALKLIGVLADGEIPSASDANQGLSVFNDMIDSWNADRLAIYTTSAADFPLTLGKQAYTLGPSGDFSMTRPARIDGMSAILLYNSANPVEVPLAMYSVDDWQNKVPVKIVNGSFPTICYDDGGFPLRSLSFWPIPTASVNVRIYAWQALPAQALTAAVSFPPGYAEAFRYNLAVRLSAEFSVPASSLVVELAMEGMARIKTMNAPDLTLQSDLVQSPTGYNYRADLFGMGF